MREWLAKIRACCVGSVAHTFSGMRISEANYEYVDVCRFSEEILMRKVASIMGITG
jgi:hypothetical protein